MYVIERYTKSGRYCEVSRTIFYMFSTLRVIPESIPWLVAKNRFKEAKEILKKAAKFNGIELPKEFQLSEEEEALLAQKVITDRLVNSLIMTSLINRVISLAKRNLFRT